MPKNQTTFYSLHIPVVALGILLSLGFFLTAYPKDKDIVFAGDTYIEEGAVFENTIQEGNKKAVMRKEYKNGKVYITIKTYDLNGKLLNEKQTTKDIGDRVVIVPKGSNTQEYANKEAQKYFENSEKGEKTVSPPVSKSTTPTPVVKDDAASEEDPLSILDEVSIDEDEVFELNLEELGVVASDSPSASRNAARNSVDFGFDIRVKSGQRFVEEGGQYFIETETDLVDATVTPDEVITNIKSVVPSIAVTTVDVDVSDKEVNYTFKGSKTEKFLGIFETRIPIEYVYNSSSTKIAESKKEVRYHLLDLFSF